jgi:hypothetical protein
LTGQLRPAAIQFGFCAQFHRNEHSQSALETEAIA